MSVVQLQSLSNISGSTEGDYPIVLNGIWSDILSYSTSISITTLDLGKSYTIINLGTSTTLDWHTAGVPGNVTPAVGVTFTAVYYGSGTGLVQNVYPTPYEVYFGAVKATVPVVLSNNAISCVVPAQTEGTVDVILTNLITGTTSILPNAFSYVNPGDITLSNIRQLAKQEADMVNSNFITDEEWNAYINASYFELYDVLIQKFGDDYFVAEPFSYTTSDNLQLYKLPDNFYKLLGAEIQLNMGMPNSWVTLKKFNFIDRNRWSYPNIYTFYGITNLRYRVNGNNLMIVPVPQDGQTMRIWYIPRMKKLINDADILDGISGWEEYIIIDACIKAWNKQESDPTVFALRKQAMLKRIEEAAENRDAGQADHVSDTKSLNYGWGAGSDGNGGSGTTGY